MDIRELLIILINMVCLSVCGQALPVDGPLTLRPVLQELGTQLSSASKKKAKQIAAKKIQ